MLDSYNGGLKWQTKSKRRLWWRDIPPQRLSSSTLRFQHEHRRVRVSHPTNVPSGATSRALSMVEVITDKDSGTALNDAVAGRIESRRWNYLGLGAEGRHGAHAPRDQRSGHHKGQSKTTNRCGGLAAERTRPGSSTESHKTPSTYASGRQDILLHYEASGCSTP